MLAFLLYKKLCKNWEKGDLFKIRKILVISVIVICIISVNLAVYMQITQKEKKTVKKARYHDTVF